MSNRKNKNKRRWLSPAQIRSLDELDNIALNMDDAPDQLKLSAKIIELMDPWLDDEEMDIVTLADCAALAWNACVNDEEDYVSRNNLNGTFDDRLQYMDIITQMKRRKERLFPNDYRLINRLQVIRDENGDPKIVVTSEITKKSVMNALEMLRTMGTSGLGEEDEP